MLGNIELERMALEMTYDGYMTVTGYSKLSLMAKLLQCQKCCMKTSLAPCHLPKLRIQNKVRTAAKSGTRQ